MSEKQGFEHYNRNQQTTVPFEHYQTIYRTLDPDEIARRCNLAFEDGFFKLRVMGREYRAGFPDYRLIDSEGKIEENAEEKILFIHYLCEGKYFSGLGGRLAYNEIPWGSVYYRNFEGRCLKRCAHTFGRDIPAFRELVTRKPGLNAEPLNSGDAGYRFEFINGLYIRLILWAGDDEFPPSAQMLFDDNFVYAFTAEDLAAVGEIVIQRLKN
jgi:hypothetical protein